MPAPPESLEDVLRLHSDPDLPLPPVPRISLTTAATQGGDPLRIIDYLRGLGIPVRCLDDLMRINADPDEDEVRSFRVREGVAITVASHGTWVLFTP